MGVLGAVKKGLHDWGKKAEKERTIKKAARQAYEYERKQARNKALLEQARKMGKEAGRKEAMQTTKAAFTPPKPQAQPMIYPMMGIGQPSRKAKPYDPWKQ